MVFLYLYSFFFLGGGGRGGGVFESTSKFLAFVCCLVLINYTNVNGDSL